MSKYKIDNRPNWYIYPFATFERYKVLFWHGWRVLRLYKTIQEAKDDFERLKKETEKEKKDLAELPIYLD